MIIFIICCLRHGSRGVQQIQIWVALKKFGNRCFMVWEETVTSYHGVEKVLHGQAWV